MATSPAVTGRIDQRLDLLLAEVEALPITAAEWDRLEEWERATASLTWSHQMADYLVPLDRHYRSREMVGQQHARYQHLLHRLREALPIVERLNFYRPPVSLEP
jgi:hypothetical protein